jgi:hypothetical protein
MDVFVAIYSHKHGQDVCVYATAALAEQARQEVAREFWYDLENPPVPVPADPADVYFSMKADEKYPEYFEILQRPVME